MCVEYLVRLVANYPEHIRGHFNLADCFMHNSDRKNAKIHYKSALKLDPNYIPALQNLGVVLAQENSFKEAIAMFEKVLVLDPDHQNAKLFLERSKEELNRTNT